MINSQLPLTTKERMQLFKQTAETARCIEKAVNDFSVDCQNNEQREKILLSVHQTLLDMLDREVNQYHVQITALLSKKVSLTESENLEALTELSSQDSQSVVKLLREFQTIRLQNLWLLSGVKAQEWMEIKSQDGKAEIRLVDVFRSMPKSDQQVISTIFTALKKSNFPITPSTRAA